MNFKLIAAAFAAMGVAACSPGSNITLQSSTSPSDSAVSTASAQPAEPAKLVEADNSATEQGAVPAAQGVKKEMATAMAAEGKQDESEKRPD